MKKVLTALLALSAVACSDEDAAGRALNAAGYTNINIHGWAFLGCSEDDTFRTSFSATGPTGIRVNGVVCSGFFKGSTIRLD